ncbi:hypothetical protein [Methylobacterium ajmalii]|uniref:hypothetical protein n=1 Tax=Methylobacterium ajmalii TaxID=2738439 RepID=UPI002F354C9D
MKRRDSRARASLALLAILGWVALYTVPFCAWLTHVVVCFRAGNYLAMVAGAIAFPIAVIHGWLIWLGIV